MFGYITVNENELKIKDFRTYREYYCGLCHALGKRIPGAGRITLTYDMTFLVLLLDGLYDIETKKSMKRCAPHPLKSHSVLMNDATEYAADMNILLSYHNLNDKWYDSKNAAALAGAKVIKRRMLKIAGEYPEQSKAVENYIHNLHEFEERQEENVEAAAAATGEMLGTVFGWRNDVWKKTLYELGFSLGRFVYYADAFNDMAEDRKKGTYNPFLIYEKKHGEEETKCFAKEALTITAADAARSFERLPVVENIDILRNILFSGIWSKINDDKSI